MQGLVVARRRHFSLFLFSPGRGFWQIKRMSSLCCARACACVCVGECKKSCFWVNPNVGREPDRNQDSFDFLCDVTAKLQKTQDAHKREPQKREIPQRGARF